MALCLNSCTERQEKQVDNIQETQVNRAQENHVIDIRKADQDNPGDSDPGETVNNERIRIISPQDSSRVGRDVIVKGTATVPAGIYVWTVARRHDFEPLWWPQREVKIDSKTKKWKTTVSLGEPHDVGWYFDIGIITVDAEGHQKLMDYWVKAMETGDWRPIRIPETTSPPIMIKVEKIRH